jgi:hypothetical protein
MSGWWFVVVLVVGLVITKFLDGMNAESTYWDDWKLRTARVIGTAASTMVLIGGVGTLACTIRWFGDSSAAIAREDAAHNLANCKVMVEGSPYRVKHVDFYRGVATIVTDDDRTIKVLSGTFENCR